MYSTLRINFQEMHALVRPSWSSVIGPLLIALCLISSLSQLHGYTNLNHIHIPKTAGYTIMDVVSKLIELSDQKSLRFASSEKCPSLSKFYTNSTKQTMVLWAIFFRRPADHVISQFMQCKHTPWGEHATEMTNFPRDLPDLEGFENWLDHMVQMGRTSRPDVSLKVADYNCYNPNDMQTRYLVCASMPMIKGGPHHLPPRELPFPLALHVLKHLPFVGIMEYMRESLCLLASMIGPLPNYCPCERKDDASFPYRVHNIPRYNTSFPLLSERSQAQMLRITEMDRILYHSAYHRFRLDLMAAEERLGVNITCQPLPADVTLSGETSIHPAKNS